LKETTINWRIYNLVQSGILERIGKGKFRLGTSKTWKPEIIPHLSTLHRKLKKQFPFLNICIWSNSVFNEFMVHQLFKYYTIVEVEKDALEPVFFWLKDAKYDVALDPTEDYIYKYLSGNGEKVVIKPVLSEAPLQKINGITVPSLEKILVDIVSEKVLFASQQGSELRNIYTEAFRKYSVITDRLLRYANRRSKREEIIEYLDKFQIYGNNNNLLPVYRK
jgi:hypothetical protein